MGEEIGEVAPAPSEYRHVEVVLQGLDRRRVACEPARVAADQHFAGSNVIVMKVL